MKINSFKFQSIANATHAWTRTCGSEKGNTHSHMPFKWNLDNLFGIFVCKLSPAMAMMMTMMKQKGNQNKTIFSFVCLACVQWTPTISTIRLAYEQIFEANFFCVWSLWRHTFAMSLPLIRIVWHSLCWYAGTKMCRNFTFEKVIRNILIRLSVRCAVFFAHLVIRTKFPRLWPSSQFPTDVHIKFNSLKLLNV